MAIKALTIGNQAGALMSKYPNGRITKIRGDHLVWRWEVQPTPLSPVYSIKMVYKWKKDPDVYVVTPKPLVLAEGKTCLPHVYNQEKQHICLYFRRGYEWSSSLFLSETVVPWIAEWLFFYEIWQYTGVWTGGGIHGGKIEN